MSEKKKSSFRNILFLAVSIGLARIVSESAGLDLKQTIGGAILAFPRSLVQLGGDIHYEIATFLAMTLGAPYALLGLVVLVAFGTWGGLRRARTDRRTGPV